MAQQQKVGKVKNLMRSGRERARNQNIRPHKIKRARIHHLKNALKSNGVEFAARLEKYYASINPVPKKAGRHRFMEG